MQKLWQQLAIATNWPVLAAVVVLSSLGAISIWADAADAGAKQLLYLGVAFACMVAFQAVSYMVIARWAWPFYIASLLLVAYTVAGSKMTLPFVHNTKGVYAWINLGPMSLEPSELVKIGFILVTARYLRYRSNYRTVIGLLPPFALALVPIILILKQPDLGVAALFLPTLLAMLFVAGARVKHMVLILAMGVMFMPIFWFAGHRYTDVTEKIRDPAKEVPVLRHLPTLMHEYQRDRVTAIFAHDPKSSGGLNYQQDHALMAFGSGGITGKGIGEVPVGRHVPEAHNDMVFSLIGEQFGFFGAAAVLGAYLVLFAAGIEIAAATKEPLGRLIAVGTVAMLACQASINLMVCLRLMPVTGVTLPFVSYGGSSLIASFMAAGLLLNVGQNRPLMIGKQAFEYD
ncbi:MAG TPA: FtsW/RodA/SpoVE family cell cycle protein [Tepidisphaeraceae bacterium]|nr:FtsW/RodA/SpoVE family cell cycle protein [Tepidisphaeraceae bacterium]